MEVELKCIYLPYRNDNLPIRLRANKNPIHHTYKCNTGEASIIINDYKYTVRGIVRKGKTETCSFTKTSSLIIYKPKKVRF